MIWLALPKKKKPRSEEELPEEEYLKLPQVHLTGEEFRLLKVQFQKDKRRFLDIGLLKEECCKFFRFKLSSPEAPFCPSPLIDKLWHAHILSTTR
jgi:hypothetical protein